MSSTVNRSENHDLQLGDKKRKSVSGNIFKVEKKTKATTAADEELEKPKLLPQVSSKRNDVSGSNKLKDVPLSKDCIEVGETFDDYNRRVNFSMPELRTRDMGALQLISVNLAGPICIEKSVEGDTEENYLALSKRLRVDRNPVKEEHCSSNGSDSRDLHHSFPNPAYPLNPGIAEETTANAIKMLQMCCEIRMSKLVEEQNKETQEFHRSWEQKSLMLEKEHKMASTLIYSEHTDPVKTEKLKILDKECAKKMKQYKQQKEMALKELEKKHLASRNDESQKATHWLTKAKSSVNGEENHIVPEVGVFKEECSVDSIPIIKEISPNDVPSNVGSVQNSENEGNVLDYPIDTSVRTSSAVPCDLEEHTACTRDGSVPSRVGMDGETPEFGAPILEFSSRKNDRGDQIHSSEQNVVKKPKDEANTFIKSNLPPIEEKKHGDCLSLNSWQSSLKREKSILVKQGQSALEDRNQDQNKIKNQMLEVKQQKELEELSIKWENNKMALEKSYRVDSALVRGVFFNLSVKLDKLKALDNEFTKKMKAHKGQRDIELENLKTKHLAEMRQMSGHSLEEAKLSTSEGRAQNELTSGSQNKKQVESSEVCKGTQSGPQNIPPSSGHLMQRQSLDEVADNMHLGIVVVADIPEPSSNGTEGDNISIPDVTVQVPHSGNDKVLAMASEEGSATAISHSSEGGCSRDGADNIVSTSPLMENQIQLPAECETAPNEVLESVDSENMRTTPIMSNNKKSGADASCQYIMNAGGMQIDGTPCSNNGTSPACDHQSPPPADLDFQNDCSQPSLSGRVQEDVSGNKSASPQVDSPLQPVVTGQCDQPNANGQVEEPPPAGVHSMLSVNAHHSQSQPNSLPVSRIVDVPSLPGQIIFNASSKSNQLAEEFTDVSDNVTLQDGENLEARPLTDVELPIAEDQAGCYAGDTLDHQTVGVLENQTQNVEVLPQAVQSTAQIPSLSGAELTIAENQARCYAGDTLVHQTVEELDSQSQDVEGLQQAVQATISIPSVSGLHTGADVPIVQGSQVISRMTPTALNSADLFQIELDTLRTEMEHVFKVHEDTKLRLKSESDKEIAELAAQIRSKYESKRLDLETEYLVKRKELDAYHNKGLKNKVLADAFRSKCLDLRPSGAMELQHAMPLSFMQQLHQLSNQTAPRPAPVGQSITQPNTTKAPPPQIVSNSAALFSSSSSTRQPNINLITLSSRNLRVSGEIRAPAPHIQPFRPSTSLSKPQSSPPPVPPLPPLVANPSGLHNKPPQLQIAGESSSNPNKLEQPVISSAPSTVEG